MGSEGPGKTPDRYALSVSHGLGPRLCSIVCVPEQLPRSTSAVGEKTPLSVYGRAERAPG